MVQLKEKGDPACFLVLKWKKKKSSHNVQKMEPDTSKVNVLVSNIDTLVSMCHNFSGKIRLYAWWDCYLVLCTF